MLSISWIALSMLLIASFVPVSVCECWIDRIARLASGRNTKGIAFLATALAFVLAVLTIPAEAVPVIASTSRSWIPEASSRSRQRSRHRAMSPRPEAMIFRGRV